MMKRKLCVAMIFATVIPLLATASAMPAPAPQGLPLCESTALAQRVSAGFEADEEFWEAIAIAFNSRDFLGRLFEAVYERGDALQIADEQHRARLDVCRALGSGAYDPNIDPSQFSTTVNNNFFPLVVGRTMIYEKVVGTETERIEVTVLNEVVEIGGYDCVSVSDIVTINGEVEEDTIDWFAQRNNGEVWYLGEIAKNYEDGLLDNLDGSWRTGKDDALPGIIMPATPAVGNFYRQEYLIGEAEDVARVVALNQTVTVPAGTYTGCLKTEDFTPIEPGVTEFKYFAPGIGLVLEVDPVSGERTELIQIR